MLFYFTLLHLILATPQLNLHHTNWVSESQSDNTLQHNCLRVVGQIYMDKNRRDIMSYCMSELPSKINVQKSNFSSKFTFAELSKWNITSKDLYLWSTPIDIIEDYQLYLNQMLASNSSALAEETYYNCTMPRFGPMCQYQLPYHYSYHSSLSHIIHDFYRAPRTYSNHLTCYMHLQCTRSPDLPCLDWSEICNGIVDCLNGGIDEEHCWELEINECEKDEYRCHNGQCIPKSFDQKRSDLPGCTDTSDVRNRRGFIRQTCHQTKEPSVDCEDVTCISSMRSQLLVTSSCNVNREEQLIEAMYSNNNNSVSEECWSAFKCLIKYLRPEYSTCDQLCEQNDCKKIVMNTCPKIMFFPNTPVLYGNIYFVYNKDDLQNRTSLSAMPLYICYNISDYDNFFVNITKIFLNNMTCTHPELFLSSEILTIDPVKTAHMSIIDELSELLEPYHLPFTYTAGICNRSNIYQCFNSPKCISIYRLIDGINDCPHMDDENIVEINNNTNIMEQLNKTYYKCEVSNKFIHQSLVKNGRCDCTTTESYWCEDEDLDITYSKRNVLFQHICDGFIDLLPRPFGERNETDETECGQWQCNNIYTRCNRKWNCLNGADESGCDTNQSLNCSSKHHLCVTPDKNQLICLPVEKANDGHVDCLGGNDEPILCTTKVQQNNSILHGFYCRNQNPELCISRMQLCDGYSQCKHGDDEQFCRLNETTKQGDIICTKPRNVLSDVQYFLCNYRIYTDSYKTIRFELHGMIKSFEDEVKSIANSISSRLSFIQILNQHRSRCHRGLDVLVWLNNKTQYTCLCPPSYYGNQCQYQNQRISLAIQFQALSDSWQTLFAIVIYLIDDSDQRTVHSYEQFTYLSVRDCQQKFNIYLLYSTRPKNPVKNYAIQIDIYEKDSLVYRRSLLYPVQFPFLPVHRLAFLVNIPSSDNGTQSCSDDRCIYGKCIKYYNNPHNLIFCQCDEGWSGRYCTIQHTCTCSSNSSCIGISPSNQSLCLCHTNKFGPQCLLTNTICESNDGNSTCQHGGQCVPNDDYFEAYKNFVCICPKGYSGDRCEIADNKFILSFNKDIVLSQSIFIHFMELIPEKDFEKSLVRATTFQTIPVKQDSITIYWSKPFHLAFMELSNKIYYLIMIEKNYKRSKTINKMINPSDRCPNITELFNQTFLQWDLIRRIKYYHLPCQNQSLNLSCFHDDVQLCLCYDFEQQRLANCFKFDHNMTFDCSGQSECEHGAQCLRDDPYCPTKSLCLCPDCFYGRRCQFSTSGFGLSLDAILGYHIIPNTSLNQQRSIIKISLVLTIIFIMIGFVNGILCIITFKNKSVCEVGCGIYLLGTSITTLSTMSIFGLKFLLLLLTQMTIISNRSFLEVQCYTIDFLLRIGLNLDQWLNACVAIERAMTVIKATAFDKKKSKRIAKYVILILFILIVITFIHDPIYRRLIDEENDYDDIKRIWCRVTYPSGLESYDYFIHSFHFFGPFLINFCSAFILITKKSRQQLRIHLHQTYKEILRKQIREHKHLLTAPIILVILALPRLILTFVSKCMKSTNDVWLFLIGYFISFIPSMLTFLIFIVPSKFYKTEFRKSLKQYRSIVQRRLHLSS